MKVFLQERHELSEADLPLLVGMFTLSVLFWSTAYSLSSYYMHARSNKHFHGLDSGLKALYLSRIVAMLHAAVAFTFGAFAYIHSWYFFINSSFFTIARMV